MPDPFISVQDLEDYLGREVTADPGALIAVDAACDMCRTVSEQTFNAGTATVTLDGTGTDALLLPQRPANTVGTVVVSGGTVTDYVLKDNGVLVRKLPVTAAIDYWSEVPYPTAVWPAGRQNVEVTYTHGYASADIPRDVAMVALAIASRLVVQGPASFETVGDSSVRYAVANTDLTNGEKAILTKYRSH